MYSIFISYSQCVKLVKWNHKIIQFKALCTCTVLMFTYKTVISGQKLFHCKITITVLEINLHNADDQMMDYILDICLYKGLFLILQKLFSEVSQAPPSAITVVPVRSSPAELAMYSTALPMSSRRPRRWTGIDFTKSSVILFPPTKFIQYCYNIIHVTYKSTQHNMY